MPRIWVLDTETKGTGARMVPLDSVLEKPAPRREPFFVPPKRKPREPRRFRIVDVVTREVLADDAPAREAVEALAVLSDVHNFVDVHVSVWEPKAERWRLLTLDEQRLLWDRRGVSTTAE